MNVMTIIVWLLYVIVVGVLIYKNIKEARAIKTRRQVINKACDWLYWNVKKFIHYDNQDIAYISEYEITEALRKVLEE